MDNQQSKTKNLILTILPLFIAIIVMIPRLISPQFGFFDDGRMLVEVNKIFQNNFSMGYDVQAGRFRPMYWLYYSCIYALAGQKPFWFFIGHLIIFQFIIVEIRLLMKQMKATNWQIFTTSMVFIFSMPIVENFYTFSKGEPLQLIFTLASVIFLGYLKNPRQKKIHWLCIIFSFLSILLAMMVKETTIIMVPIAVIWTGYVYLKRNDYSKKCRQAYLIYLVTAILATILCFILRTEWGLSSVLGGTYTNRYALNFMSLLPKFARWLTLFAHYFHYLLPFAGIALISIFKTKLNDSQRLNLFNWGIWALLWLAVLIPWEYAEVYYLLPLSLGLSFIIGLLLSSITESFLQSGKWIRGVLISLSVLSVILFLATLPTYRTHARIQIIFDKINHQMLTFANEVIPANGAVYTCIDNQNEYVEHISHFLITQYGRANISYNFIDLNTLENLRHASKGIILMPKIKNQPNLLVRAGVEEEFTMAWNDTVLEVMGDQFTLMKTIEEDFRIININLPILLCSILGERGFCENPDPIIDVRWFSYGWEVYQIR